MSAFFDTFAMLIATIVGLGLLFALGIAMRVMLSRRAAVKELAELSKLLDDMEVTYTADFPPQRPTQPAILIDEPIERPQLDYPTLVEPEPNAVAIEASKPAEQP